MRVQIVPQPKLVSLEELRAAHDRVREEVHETPVVTSAQFDAAVGGGRSVVFKCENLQKCGSHKIRGALNVLADEMEKYGEKDAFVTYTTGNLGQALACSAKKFGKGCYVVCHKDTPLSKRQAMAGYGASVVLIDPPRDVPGGLLGAFEKKVEELSREHNALYLDPWDYRLIAGKGTVGLEFHDQLKGDYDAVLVPVGSGGLSSGVASAVKLLNPNALVIGVQSEHSKPAKECFEARQLVAKAFSSYSATICDGITGCPSESTLAHLVARMDKIITVTDQEVLTAMRFIFSRMKMVVEPSGAVGAAALLSNRVRAEIPAHIKRPVVVFSGGNFDRYDLLVNANES